MSRSVPKSIRKQIAEETLKILDQGSYSANGEEVNLSEEMARAVAESFCLHESDPIEREPRSASATARASGGTTAAAQRIVAFSGTALEALYSLSTAGNFSMQRVMLLNFASAKNPGGGFLGGAQAQEESLARSSALYPCLTKFLGDMYANNRRNNNGCLYSDDMIFSPSVPFFRLDDGTLLPKPVCCSVISSPAPNAGAAKQWAKKEVMPVLRRRLRRVLTLASSQGLDILILGAWGCGVFGNDVAAVAREFRDALAAPEFDGAFAEVHFPIPDTEMFRIFSCVLDATNPTKSATDASPSGIVGELRTSIRTSGGPAAGDERFEDDDDERPRVLNVELVSFGYESGRGVPPADAVFSARHLANPEGGAKTQFSGLDARLRKEVMACDGARQLLQEIFDFVLQRGSADENAEGLRIAVGCAHGKHRSVSLCVELESMLKRRRTKDGQRIHVRVSHREQDLWSGKSGQSGKSSHRRWAKGGQRSSRQRVIRDGEEIEAENSLLDGADDAE